MSSKNKKIIITLIVVGVTILLVIGTCNLPNMVKENAPKSSELKFIPIHNNPFVGFQVHGVIIDGKDRYRDLRNYGKVTFVYFDANFHQWTTTNNEEAYQYVDARKPFGFYVEQVGPLRYIVNQTLTRESNNNIIGTKTVSIPSLNNNTITFNVINDSGMIVPEDQVFPLGISFWALMEKNPKYIDSEWLLLGYNVNNPECYYKITYADNSVKIFANKPDLTNYVVNELNSKNKTCVRLSQ